MSIYQIIYIIGMLFSTLLVNHPWTNSRTFLSLTNKQPYFIPGNTSLAFVNFFKKMYIKERKKVEMTYPRR